MSRAIVSLFGLILLAFVAVYVFQAGLETAGTQETVTETINQPSGGDIVSLEQSGRDAVFYDETVNVTDENGNLTVAGEDYEWFNGNGTIKILTGGMLDGDNSATIEYGYTTPTTEQRQFADLLGVIPHALGVAIPFITFVVFLMLMKGGLG